MPGKLNPRCKILRAFRMLWNTQKPMTSLLVARCKKLSFYYHWSRGWNIIGTCTNHWPWQWRRWSLSRPNESMRRWNRYGRIRRHRQRNCFRRKSDYSNAENNSILLILYNFLEGSVQFSQKQMKDWRLYTVHGGHKYHI